jgi:DNA-binding MarR family transcriptional regulator
VAGRLGLGERRWRVLAVVAEYGMVDTGQVALLVSESRPTVHRALAALHAAGLLERKARPRSSDRRWLYWVSRAGLMELDRRAPSALEAVWEFPSDLGLLYSINQVFMDLVVYARRVGDAELYRWWSGVRTDGWLRAHRLPDVSCDGHGIWIDGGVTVRFTLHWAQYARAPEPPDVVLAGYDDGGPVDMVLVVDHPQMEPVWHAAAARRGVPVVVATTSRPELAASPDGAAGAVWAAGSGGARCRLRDLAGAP